MWPRSATLPENNTSGETSIIWIWKHTTTHAQFILAFGVELSFKILCQIILGDSVAWENLNKSKSSRNYRNRTHKKQGKDDIY